MIANNISHLARPRCLRCLRPHSTCLCRWVVPVWHPVEVLILQHPLEVDHAKGTARLLHLSLPNSRLVVGEKWASEALEPLLKAPWPGTARAPQPVLLYPETAHAAALQLPAPPPWDAAAPGAPAQLRLVVLDGTWRKSRKMLYLNPPLQMLARLPLHSLPASRYRIRQAHAPGQLSTLEATCAALAQLDGGAAPLDAVLAAFDGFVARQLQHRSHAKSPPPAVGAGAAH